MVARAAEWLVDYRLRKGGGVVPCRSKKSTQYFTYKQQDQASEPISVCHVETPLCGSVSRDDVRKE